MNSMVEVGRSDLVSSLVGVENKEEKDAKETKRAFLGQPDSDEGVLSFLSIA
jgi:hypothetical protein